MKRVVIRPYIDFESEERFLNEMSKKGWALTQYTWCKYTFEDVPKGKYIFRIELLENPVEHPKSQEYIRFMEETGAKLVSSYNRWVYFRRDAAEGEFDIYSDIDSRLKHYRRIQMFFIAVTAINLFVGLLNAVSGNTYIALIPFILFAYLVIFIHLPLVNKIGTLEKEKGIRG